MSKRKLEDNIRKPFNANHKTSAVDAKDVPNLSMELVRFLSSSLLPLTLLNFSSIFFFNIDFYIIKINIII